jgi:uncharacterized circularly permuted ATP-grasp superfamily protein
VVLTPDYNSARSTLFPADGIELVRIDLVVVDEYVYMRTTRGQTVDVIYRRIGDDFPTR